MCNNSTPQECSTKTRSVDLLDKAKCLEIQGQIDAARASLIEADRDSKDWRFEFDRIMFEARQGAAHELLQSRVEEAVEVEVLVQQLEELEDQVEVERVEILLLV